MSEIDKQYWQTVNSVKVNGAGRTNYVVTKDDIGNWYVKGYSADPQDIIKGAQSLALFSMGGHFQANTFDKLRQVVWRQRRGREVLCAGHQAQPVGTVDGRPGAALSGPDGSGSPDLVKALDDGGAPQRLRLEWVSLAKVLKDGPADERAEAGGARRADVASGAGGEAAGHGRRQVQGRGAAGVAGTDANQAVTQYILETAAKKQVDPYAGVRVTDAYGGLLLVCVGFWSHARRRSHRRQRRWRAQS